MTITGEDLSLKIRQLLPNHSYKLTPKLLNETCDNSSVQPFLKWFCEHVGSENTLFKEEVQLRKRLQETGAWLTGDELDRELASATKDCPELLQLAQLERISDAEICRNYEAEKEAYDADVEDIEALEDNLKKLTDLELQLEEELEAEQAELDKLKIQENKTHTDCAGLVDEFDSACREAYEDVQNLIGVYANAAEKKGPPVVWTQVPLDLFIKHMDTYYNYLKYHVDREFKRMHNGALSVDDDHPDEQSSEQSQNMKAYELLTCQNNLISSILDEIESKKELNSSEALANHAMEIYNNGEVKVPESIAQIKVELAELISRRDTLEETNILMDGRLQETVSYYAKFVITNILVENGRARLERRKNRLSKIEKLVHFARDMGHAPSDLLSILMQIQLRKLNEIVEFVNDARYHVAAEYSHATKRCEFMQKEQDKFNLITTSPTYKQNIFNELFSSLMLGVEKQIDALDLSRKQYSELLVENKRMKEEILGSDLDTRIEILRPMERDVMVIYDHETSDGPTKSFKLMPYKIISQLEEVTSNTEAAQSAVNETRKKFKDIVTKTANGSLEREKSILWQRFIADHETLKFKHDEAQKIIDRSHFVNSLDT